MTLILTETVTLTVQSEKTVAKRATGKMTPSDTGTLTVTVTEKEIMELPMNEK